jgi:hypothetical protein
MKRYHHSSLLGFTLGLLCVIFLSPLPSLFSEEPYSLDEAIITIGIGEIIGNDLVSTRERAIEDAQKKAIVQAVAREISLKIMEDNYKILNEKLYLQGQRFIESFKVLSEVPQGNFYRITIQFALSRNDLRNELKKLGITRQFSRIPRILLMVAEKDIGQKQYIYWWSYENSALPLTLMESILKGKLQERGIYVVDHIALLKELVQYKRYSREINLSEEAMKEYGKQFDADIVINGNVEMDMIKAEGDNGMKSVQANIAAKAIQVENGRVFMVTSFYAPASNTDEATAKREALKKALGMLSYQVTDLINRQWKGKADSKIIFLKVVGLGNFSAFLTFKEEVKRRIPEITGIYPRGISPENSQIDVETKLDIPTFVQMLTSRNFEGFNLNVLSSSPALIELKIDPKSVPSILKSTP